MELPLSVVRAGAERVALPGFTKNISSCGVLFTAAAAPDLSGPIEYIITLNRECPQPVNLRCVGKVLRAERAAPSGDAPRNVQFAVTLERYEFVRTREKALTAPAAS
jgi:hypothetical protein